MLFCFITFKPTCFAPAVAAVSAKLRAILENKICKNLQFLCRFVNSVHVVQSAQSVQSVNDINIVLSTNISISTIILYLYEGRPINKLQNGIILLIFKI